MVLGLGLVLLVVFLSPALRIRWPVSNALVLMAAQLLPIVLGGLLGLLSGPAIPGRVRALSLALRGNPSVLSAATLHPEVLALHISRRFTAIYLVPAIAMTSVSAFLILVATEDLGPLAAVVGWAGLLFFGLITAFLLVQVTWPSRFGLSLDSEGFSVRMNLGSRRYRWTEVERFFPYQTVSLQPVVAFKYRGKAQIHGIQWTRGAFGSFDGTLPQNLSVRGLALLDLVERWRLETTNRPGTSGPPHG